VSSDQLNLFEVPTLVVPFEVGSQVRCGPRGVVGRIKGWVKLPEGQLRALVGFETYDQYWDVEQLGSAE
jgi:hypothetical protein